MKKKFLAVTLGIIAAFGVLALGGCKNGDGNNTPPPQQELPDPPPINGILKIAGSWTVSSLIPTGGDPNMGPPSPIQPMGSEYSISISEEGEVRFEYFPLGGETQEAAVYTGTAVMSESYAYSFTFSGTSGEKSISAQATYNESNDELYFSNILITYENGDSVTPFATVSCKRGI